MELRRRTSPAQYAPDTVPADDTERAPDTKPSPGWEISRGVMVGDEQAVADFHEQFGAAVYVPRCGR